ncbi:MAG TPA: stage V sporulation protein B [Clostridiaceae bacterium]
MNKSSFVKNSFILTLSNLATYILGFIFSIALSKQLGPEGMGLYGLVRPLYMVFTCLACGGLVTAVSKISAAYYGRGDYKNVKRTIKTLLPITFLWSVFIAVLLFLFSSTIGTYIIRDARTINALKLLCPAIVFVAISNCLKGYFYCTFQVSVPAIIDIFEKAIRIVILVTIVSSLKLVNVTTTVTGAYFALCIGEFISFILLYGYYKFNIKKIPYTINKGESRAQLLFNTISISFPLLLTGLIASLLSTCSALIIPSRLVSSGIEYKVALGMLGKFNGMAKNIVFFPMVVIESISLILIPDLSMNLSKKHFKSVDTRISKILELSFLLGITTMIISLCIGDNLGFMLYKRNDLGNYIKFASLAAPIFYTASTTFGVLNGLGKQKILLRNSIIVSLVRILLLYILTAIPSINIYGYGITMIVTSLISLILNLYEIKKLSHLKLNFFHYIFDCLIASFTYFILVILTKILSTNWSVLSNILIILLGFIIMFLFRNTFGKGKTKTQ